MTREEIKEAQKNCPKCLHKNFCMSDRIIMGFPGMINPIIGTYEERCKWYEEAEEAMKKPCEDFIDEAIVEKQIPKKPKIAPPASGDALLDLIQITHICPACEAPIKHTPYCHNCGQALDMDWRGAQ